MKRNEFITCHNHLKRQITVWSAFLFALLLSILLGAAPLCRWSVERWNVDVSTMQGCMLGVIAFCVVMIMGVLVHIGHVHQVNCPKCGTSIQAGNLASIAIATGKCGNCGSEVFSEM